jgi:hypothetical protein
MLMHAAVALDAQEAVFQQAALQVVVDRLSGLSVLAGMREYVGQNSYPRPV